MPASASISEKISTNSRLRNDQSMTRLIRASSFCIVHLWLHVFARFHTFAGLQVLMGLHAFDGSAHRRRRIEQELAVDRHFCAGLDAVGDLDQIAVLYS